MSKLTLAEKENKASQLRKNIDNLQAQVNPLVKELVQLNKEINEEKFSQISPLTWEKLFSVPMTVVETDQGFKEMSQLTKTHPYVYISGHNVVTKTKWVEVMFYQTKEFKNQLDIVLDVLQHLPYQTEAKGFEKIKNLTLPSKFKLCGVFHNNSEFDGIFNILIDEKNMAHLINTRYHQTSLTFSGSLNSVLKYVYDNHPYESLESDSDDGDDDDECHC